jgi:hypothetical protein
MTPIFPLLPYKVLGPTVGSDSWTITNGYKMGNFPKSGTKIMSLHAKTIEFF